MKFPTKLVSGRLIKRYKRFLADVALDSGEEITAHCANPGAMTGLNEPGAKVWLSLSDNPKRKLKYSWELIEITDRRKRSMVGPLVGINTAHPNGIVAEAIRDDKIKELAGYGALRREVKYGANSRIDILLEDDGRPPCYVEVKNVHLMRKQGLAEFPDSVTARGTKHLGELTNMVRGGNRAVMFYLVQRSDADHLSIAGDIDPQYARAFDQARRAGVEMLAYDCRITLRAISVARPVPLLMPLHSDQPM